MPKTHAPAAPAANGLSHETKDGLAVYELDDASDLAIPAFGEIEESNITATLGQLHMRVIALVSHQQALVATCEGFREQIKGLGAENAALVAEIASLRAGG